MKFCLVGNPNCGKTTLFNRLTGLNQKVGNYSGVTVDKHSGQFTLGGQTAEIVDLPGTHSIYPKTLDETIVFNTLIGEASQFDAVILVLNVNQIRRNLVLTTQIIDLGLPCYVVVNMIDEASSEKAQAVQSTLQKELNVPVHLVSARNGHGINELKQEILKGKAEVAGQSVFNISSNDLQTLPNVFGGEGLTYSTFVQTILADKATFLNPQQKADIKKWKETNQFSDSQMMAKEIQSRFAWVQSVLKDIKTTKAEKEKSVLSITQKIDQVLTHKYFGLPIAFMVLFLVFQAIFSFASYPMDFIELLFASVTNWVESILPDNWLRSLITEGILAGLSGVLIFIPQIAILFGLLAILESTGYMARISFMLDKVMKKFGLSGKTILPMMSGFACAIPAIMATRNLKSWKERLITILVIPLLSCSARLPVYILLIGMLVSSEAKVGIFKMQGIVMMGFYLFGIVLALTISSILHFALKTNAEYFYVMELPKYRQPKWSNILRTMYEKAKVFTIEAGKIIFVLSIVLWFVSSYGPKKKIDAVEAKYSTIEQTRELTQEESVEKKQELLVNSYAGHFGKAIEPVIKPLGYDWKIGIALLTSFAAREVFVGTMATIYSVGDEEDHLSLREKMLKEKDKNGRPVYSIATVASLLIFFAVAMQCMSTLAVVKRETKSWKWTMIQLVYLTVLAYGLSFSVYQLLS